MWTAYLMETFASIKGPRGPSVSISLRTAIEVYFNKLNSLYSKSVANKNEIRSRCRRTFGAPCGKFVFPQHCYCTLSCRNRCFEHLKIITAPIENQVSVAPPTSAQLPILSGTDFNKLLDCVITSLKELIASDKAPSDVEISSIQEIVDQLTNILNQNKENP